MEKTDFLIIGAGLQGCCIAMELALQGKNVILVDQDEMAMNRASLRNEGKIHLGLIYAGDASGRTARLQLKGALHFENLLRRWIGSRFDDIGISTPFCYLVAQDSLQGAENLGNHYSRLRDECSRMVCEDGSLNYLGRNPASFATPIKPEAWRGCFDASYIAAGFETEELAIDTNDLSVAIRRALTMNQNIRLVSGLKMDAVKEAKGSFQVSGAYKNSAREIIEAVHVVNATWEQRLRLDAQLGMEPSPGWLHRLKYRVIVKLPPEMNGFPSATMVMGRYGDVVVRPDNTGYLSWYPSGLQGWSHDLAPPDAWDIPCSGRVPFEQANRIGSETIARISAWYPAIARSEILTVDAGAIFAYGRTDVDDRASELHDRSRIGVMRKGNYLSVDPGKLTTAPLFAVEAVQQLLEN